MAEVPPGPPVLQTLVAEVYGPTQEGQLRIARQIRDTVQDGLKASWMSTGTSKTTIRSSNSRSTKRRLPSTAFPKKTSARDAYRIGR